MLAGWQVAALYWARKRLDGCPADPRSGQRGGTAAGQNRQQRFGGLVRGFPHRADQHGKRHRQRNHCLSGGWRARPIASMRRRSMSAIWRQAPAACWRWKRTPAGRIWRAPAPRPRRSPTSSIRPMANLGAHLCARWHAGVSVKPFRHQCHLGHEARRRASPAV